MHVPNHMFYSGVFYRKRQVTGTKSLKSTTSSRILLNCSFTTAENNCINIQPTYLIFPFVNTCINLINEKLICKGCKKVFDIMLFQKKPSVTPFCN